MDVAGLRKRKRAADPHVQQAVKGVRAGNLAASGDSAGKPVCILILRLVPEQSVLASERTSRTLQATNA